MNALKSSIVSNKEAENFFDINYKNLHQCASTYAQIEYDTAVQRAIYLVKKNPPSADSTNSRKNSRTNEPLGLSIEIVPTVSTFLLSLSLSLSFSHSLQLFFCPWVLRRRVLVTLPPLLSIFCKVAGGGLRQEAPVTVRG